MIPKLIKNILRGIYQVLLLEDLFPHHIRRVVFHMFGSASLILVLVLVFGGDIYDKHIRGGLFLCTSITLFLFTLECYFYSILIKSRESFFVSFDIGEVLFYANDEDLTKALLFSEIGDEGMKRLGYNEDEIKDFLTNREHVQSKGVIDSITDHVYYAEYFSLVYKNDINLQDFLFQKGIQEKEFVGAMSWVVQRNRKIIEKERFWSYENLSKIPGIGKNWSYGETYALDKYGEDLTERAVSYNSSYQKSKDLAVTRLESVLLRGRGSNAIIVSDSESSRLDVVTMFAQKINQGKVSLGLQHKRVYLINPNEIIESTSDKITFEREFATLLSEAAHAGNVVLVIPFLSAFIKSAGAIGSNILDVLLPLLQNPAVHIFALDSQREYLEFLSNKEVINQNFEEVLTDSGDEEALITMLTDEADGIEEATKMIVTFPAILTIITTVNRFFDPAVKAEKCREIIIESIGVASKQGRGIVLREDILGLVEVKTGIPTSAPKAEEKSILQNLEALLHNRIIGQDEAVRVVAEAFKRNRAGVGNPDKPIGTFLFLGPTGVGKTETTKALAQIVFKSEDVISRFDMSEYRDEQAVERLIGSFATGKSGNLSMALREKPYGVLLLDEFEKTTSDVINLFLRVFDEGVFTDADGKKINAKNNVIIATSNAGSEIIWESMRNGEDLSQSKDKIINSIIAQGVFKPELLNRFDAVVLFHPLAVSDLKKIAQLMMSKLQKRMRERGVIIETTDGFIDYLVSKGNDPKFGARPMNRAISDEVEKLIANKIIDGDIKTGSKITFNVDDKGQVILQ